MKQKSIVKNYLYNTIWNILKIIFPLITFPYVTRVLGPEMLGKVYFADSFLGYFIMFAMLGIPIYGLREIAKCRDNKEILSKTVNEILLINLFSMLIAVALFFISFKTINKIQTDKLLFLILLPNLILTIFSLDWFYKGIEDFKFITIRNIFFKVLSIVLLFIIVRGKSDYLKYAFLIVVAASGSFIINFLNLRKYVIFKFKNLNLKQHLKPILIIFATTVSIGIYIKLDSVMLGFLAGDYYVGLYNASVKINRIILALVTSLGVVLIPRLSYFVKNKQINEFKKYVGKSFDFVLMLSIPCVVLMIFLSKNIILFLSGHQFHEAVLSMQIIAPIILLIGLSNILGIQILIPFNKEKFVFYSVSVGAIVNFLLNLFLIPIYQHIGAAIATIIAEIAVTITQLIFVSHVLKIRIFRWNRLIYLFLAIILIPLILFIKQIDLSLTIEMFLTGFIFMIVYFLVLYLSKDEFFYKTVFAKLFQRYRNV